MTKNKINNKNLEEAIFNEVTGVPKKMPRVKISRVDTTHKWTIIILSSLILLILAFLVCFIIYRSSEAFSKVGFFNFIFGTTWDPANNDYGIFNTILSTITMLLFSLLFAIPITIFSSLFITEYLRGKTKKTIIGLIQLLAGIPSVVFGLFAINNIGNIFIELGANSGSNMMTASVTLAFMSLPTMISLSVAGLESLPDGYRYASLGLGISKEHTTFTVILRAGWSKITSAIIMGMARIIGETKAVILIAGNSTAGLDTVDGLSGFLFSSIRTLAGTIGLEMLENQGQLHESSLYAIAFILFVIVIIINLTVLLISRPKKRTKLKHSKSINNNDVIYSYYNSNDLSSLIKIKTAARFNRKVESSLALFFMISSTLIVAAFTLWIIGDVVVKGFAGFNFDYFVNIEGQNSGILAIILTTFLLVISTTIIAIPFALFVAIFLWAYSNPKSTFTKIVRFSISVLSSTPSIVYGVFGLTVFVIWFKLPMSIFASSLTMTLVIIPTLVTSFESALEGVAPSYVEASIGLGVKKTRTIWLVVIPAAMRGLVTGTILAIARIIGESAPVYLTLGTAVRMPVEGFLSSGATLSTEIYMLVSEGTTSNITDIAYMISMVTLILVILLNLLSNMASNSSAISHKKTTLCQKIVDFNIKFKNFSIKIWGKNIFYKIKTTITKSLIKLSPKNIKQNKVAAREIRQQLTEIKNRKNVSEVSNNE